MPIRGETVGTAYIRILADGKGLDRSIKEQFDQNEAAFEESGRDAERAWEQGGAAEAKRNKTLAKGLDAKLDREFGRMEKRADFMGKGFVDRLNKGIIERLKTTNPELGNAAENIGKRITDSIAKDFARTGQFTINLSARLGEALKAANAEAAKFEREWRRDFNSITKTVERNSGKIVSELDRITEVAITTGAAMKRQSDTIDREWVSTSETIRKEMEKNSREAGSFIRKMDDLGDSVGRAFGKGARNDFINLFGSMMGNFARVPGLLGKVGVGMVAWGKTMGDVFRQAGEGFGPVVGGIRGMIGVSGAILPALGAAGLGVITFTTLLGTLTTALLLAAGAAAALVSTLAFGLIGAVAPLVGLFGPLGLAVAGVATAFIGMDKAAKKSLKETFEPLKEELKSLGDAARPGILDGLTAAAENLEEPMKRLRPLFKVVGDSIGDFIDISSRIAFGPGFEKFVETMSKTMPDTMRTLGRITGHAFDGLFGLFATLQPVTTTFLNALDKITANFAKWSISPEAGTFFANAAESAKALLDFIEPVWELTKQILDAGRGAGNELFRSMGEAVQGWVNAINRDPNLLSDFFDDAVKMGKAIGRAVEAVGKLIGALDTPTTRMFAIELVDSIGDVISAVATAVGWFGKLDGSLQLVVIAIGAAAMAWGPLSKAITGISGNLSTFGANMRTAEGRLTTLKGAARAASGPAGLGLLAAGAMEASGPLSTLETTLGGVLTGFSVAGPWGALIGGGLGLAASAFRNLTDDAEQTRTELLKSEGFAEATADAKSLADALIGVTNEYGQVTRAAIEASFTGEDGKLDKDIAKLRELGFSMDTIVSATLGQGEETVLARLGTEADSASTRVETLSQKLHDGADGVLVVEDAMGHLSEVEVSPAQIDAWEKELEDATTEVEDITAAAATFEERIRANGVTIQEHSALVSTLRTQLGLTAKEYKNLPTDVKTDIEARGLPQSVAGAERLIGKYKSLQNFRSIRAVVSAPGVDLTAKDIQRLAGRYRLVPKQIRTLVKQEGVELTRQQFRRLIKDAKDVGKQKPEVTVKANTKPARDDIKKVGDDVKTTDRKTAEPKFKADKKNFDEGNRKVKQALDDTNRKSADPKITVNASAAFTTINSLETALNNIPDETVYINVQRRGARAAAGGIFSGSQPLTVGEEGPEAVVPLSRALSRVDPAVRELSAIAQGMMPVRGGQDTRAVGKTIDVGGITVITPTEDPGAVAQEVVNRLAVVGY